MTFEEWLDKYKPVNNHLDDNASFQDENGNGIMFETYGDELEYVRSVAREDSTKVWTYVDGDDGTYLLCGYHVVNRIGYFITEVSCNNEQDAEVLVSLNEEEEC